MFVTEFFKIKKEVRSNISENKTIKIKINGIESIEI
jgi:hypothetical protein